MFNYYLKYKDNIVAKIIFNGMNFNIAGVFIDISSPVFYMLRNDNLFNYWIKKRQTIYERPYTSELYKLADIKSDIDFVNLTYCLSLNDCFWLVKEDSKKSWNSVNLFNKSFAREYTELASGLHGFNGTPSNNYSPELTLRGATKKFVVRQNKKIFLLKNFSFNNTDLLDSGVFSEYFVSQLLKYIGCKYFVNYEIVTYNNNIYSKCMYFTNENINSLDLIDYIFNFSNRDTVSNNINQLFIMFYGTKFIDILKCYLVIDCLVLNVDRHPENISFVYSNDFVLDNLSPVFDFDHSLFYDLSLENNLKKRDILHYLSSKSPRTYTGHSFKEQYDLCKTEKSDAIIKDLIQNFEFKQHPKYKISNKRLERINYLFKTILKGHLNV